jgi:cell wall assembly regulator SMI1
MSTKEIAQTWKMLTTTERRVREQNRNEPQGAPMDEWWNVKWIPFADLNGDALCIDMSDPSSRDSGKVVRFVHDNPVERNLAESYAEWLDQVAVRLEEGRFAVDDMGWIKFEEL